MPNRPIASEPPDSARTQVRGCTYYRTESSAACPRTPAATTGEEVTMTNSTSQYGIQPDEPAGPGGRGTPSFGMPGPQHAAARPAGAGAVHSLGAGKRRARPVPDERQAGGLRHLLGLLDPGLHRWNLCGGERRRVAAVPRARPAGGLVRLPHMERPSAAPDLLHHLLTAGET